MYIDAVDRLKVLGKEMRTFGFVRGGLRALMSWSRGSRMLRAILRTILRSDTVFEQLIDCLIRAAERNPHPEKVYAESTNACNAKCIMCPRDEMTRKIGIMDFELYQRLVEQCVALNVQELRFHNYGEVMIDPLLPKKIDYAKQAGIPSTAMYTNGSLLNERLGEQILEVGLDKMFVSIDGTDKPTFDRIRRHLDFDEVVGNVRDFLERRNARGLRKPYTEIVLLPIDVTDAGLRDFRASWDGLADSVRVSRVHDFAGQGPDQYVTRQSNGNVTTHKVKRLPCYMLWRDMYILWNGQVTLCCLDFDGKHDFGNAVNAPIDDIWRGEKLEAVRAAHRQHAWTQLDLCSTCHVNVYWDVDSKWETLKLWL